VTSEVASTVEALLKRLQRNPKTVTTSTLNTVLNAVRLLEAVGLPGVEEKLASHPPIRILVVDDEPLARRAVVGALQLVFKQPESATDGTKACRMVKESAFDVIFTDIQMPGLNGFELCAAIRVSSLNGHTPVVFITNNTDAEAQARAAACGGNDFIGKPFLPIEITTKALTFAWEGRLRKMSGQPPTTALLAA
jgi:CheY-like chemotaxis protein